MTSSHSTTRRLIEEWLPINEISVDAIREGGALAGHPPVNQLHVWWARRPLVAARAAVAASLLKFDTDHKSFIAAVGSSSAIVSERQDMDAAKARGVWSDVTFSNERAFKHNLTLSEADWLRENLAVPDPLVVDITSGGGSIPFETGRLGLRSIANELNPVAALILRATCQWPQQYGYDLLDTYSAVSTRFRKRVDELLEGVYPQEPQLSEAEKRREFETTRAQRYDQTYLWARVVFCPSCKGRIPLSPNWRLTSGGTGIRLIPDVENGTCDFEIVNRVARTVPRYRQERHRNLPFPQLWSHNATRLHLPGSPGWPAKPPTLLRHLPGPVVASYQVRQAQEATQDQARLPNSHPEGQQFRVGRPTAEGTRTAVGRCRYPPQ